MKTIKLYHFTTDEGAESIMREGVIRPNSKGKVYVTDRYMTPEEAHERLFIGSPLYRDRKKIIAFEAGEDALAQVDDESRGYETIFRNRIRQGKNGFGEFQLVA